MILTYIKMGENEDLLMQIINKPHLFEVVDDENKTDLMCMYVILKSSGGRILKSIPQEKRTYPFCFLAVKKSIMNYKDVPDEMKTDEMNLLVVKADSHMLKRVPPHKITSKLAETAVKKCGMALEHVPKELQTTKIIKIAVDYSWRAIQFVQNTNALTPEICRVAHNANPKADEFIPPKLMELIKSGKDIKMKSSKKESKKDKKEIKEDKKGSKKIKKEEVEDDEVEEIEEEDE